MSGQDKKNLHCSQVDSPSSHSHPSDSGKGLRTPVTSVRKCAESLRNCGPVTCLARMLLTSSIWGSTKRSLIWKRRDMPSGHSYFLLAPSVRGMSGNELSSWGLIFPTPLATDMGTKGRMPKVLMTSRGRSAGGGQTGDIGRRACQKRYTSSIKKEDAVAMRINPEWVEWMMGFPKGWTESVSGA